MTPVEAAKKILDTMLGHLGFHVTIEIQDSVEGPCLQMVTTEAAYIVGKEGERLDDLQYLVNRVLKKHFPKAPRIRVDCEHYRSIQEDKLSEEVRSVAERVKATGKTFTMRPLNAYYRRLVHNALVEFTEVESISPEGEERLKRIIIRPKKAEAGGVDTSSEA